MKKVRKRGELQHNTIHINDKTCRKQHDPVYKDAYFKTNIKHIE